MKFIEDHQADAFQRRVVLQPPRQNAFGDHFDTGAWADLAVQADAITDGFPHRLTQLAGQALGRSARCQPTWLKHDDGLPGQPGLLQQRQRHTGGLAGTGRRFQHRFVTQGKGLTQLRQQHIDWQGIHAGSIQGAGL